MTAKPSPRDPAATQQSGRDALIAATVHVVAHKGMRGLTFRAVAEVAGVNNSLIAHHFGTRDALIEAAFDWCVHESITLSHLDEFAISREGFVASLMTMLRSNPEREIFQYEMLLAARRRPDIAPKVLAQNARYVETLTAALTAARGETFSAAQARYIFAALDGLVLQGLSGVATAELEAAVGALWDDTMRTPTR